MTDIIEYQIPFGTLGIIGLPVVKKQLANIFNYRRKKVEEMFDNNGKKEARVETQA